MLSRFLVGKVGVMTPNTLHVRVGPDVWHLYFKYSVDSLLSSKIYS